MYLPVYHCFNQITASTHPGLFIIQGLKTLIKCLYYFFIPFGINNTTYLCRANFKL
jgi:hypothetical protein